MKDYLLDIKKQVDSTDFGDIVIHVKRARSKTTTLGVQTTDTHNFNSNKEALESLLLLVDRLLTTEGSYEIDFNMRIKQGIIRLIGYKNIKTTNYGNQNT